MTTEATAGGSIRTCNRLGGGGSLALSPLPINGSSPNRSVWSNREPTRARASLRRMNAPNCRIGWAARFEPEQNSARLQPSLHFNETMVFCVITQIIMNNATTEPTQRLNVDLPKSQYFALKSHALHHDTTVSQSVRDALRGIVEYDEWCKAKVHAALIDTRPAFDEKAWVAVRVKKLAQRDALGHSPQKRALKTPAFVNPMSPARAIPLARLRAG